MDILQFDKARDLTNVVSLYRRAVTERGFYKPLDIKAFEAAVSGKPAFANGAAYVCYIDGAVAGFGCGAIRPGEEDDPEKPAYLPVLITAPEHRRKGVATALLKRIETALSAKGKRMIRCVFSSTVSLPWYVPGEGHHDHPCAPAIPINTEEYFFLLRNGYYINGIIDAFHLSLSDYKIPDGIYGKMKDNEARGFKIEFYKQGCHYGVDEFCEQINNPGFANAIKSNLALEEPLPFLVVSQNGKMVGWTGAMYTEPSGRAHFDGITVSPSVRGNGLGKALFCKLCEESKNGGSSFMTFYTGLDNPARYIYLSAGFHIVQTFAIMKKEI